jgi:hypothetical protein
MNQRAAITDGDPRRAAGRRASGDEARRCRALLRSALQGLGLLDRVVRSLFKRVAGFVPRQDIPFRSLLLKPTHALLLAGLRSAGAGGGGPGR